LRLEPKTTITIGAPRPATIIVTPGHTAIVSSVHGSLPTVVATPPEGGTAALEATVSGMIANSNHHRR